MINYVKSTLNSHSLTILTFFSFVKLIRQKMKLVMLKSNLKALSPEDFPVLKKTTSPQFPLYTVNIEILTYWNGFINITVGFAS